MDCFGTKRIHRFWFWFVVELKNHGLFLQYIFSHVTKAFNTLNPYSHICPNRLDKNIYWCCYNASEVLECTNFEFLCISQKSRNKDREGFRLKVKQIETSWSKMYKFSTHMITSLTINICLRTQLWLTFYDLTELYKLKQITLMGPIRLAGVPHQGSGNFWSHKNMFNRCSTGTCWRT